MPSQQDLFDELLAQAIDILRLGAAEKKKVIARLAKLEKVLIGKLSKTDLPKLTRRDLNKVLTNASASIGAYYSQIADLTDYAGIARYVAQDTSYAFEIGLGVDALKLPRQSYFESVNSNVSIEGAVVGEWWKAQASDTAFKFAGQVRQGLTNGETNQQIIQRIVGKEGQAGVMDTARRNAASLVQTSVQTVANDARRNTFKANPGSVKGIRQVSTLDSHTTKVCMAYSGAEWDLNYKPIGKNKLPFKGGCPRHFNCRSLEVPITPTFRELGIDIDEPGDGTRASDEGQVPADISFDAFLKRKPKAYIDEKLGVGRAELFRAGKITLRDLVNGDGNERTLEQLRELAAGRRSR